jgi:hypothetical protein
MMSRYGDYDVLAKWSSPDWDDQTRRVVAQRLHDVPPLRFFSEREATVLEAVAARILMQSQHKIGDRVPIVPWIDEKLLNDRRDGYRYEELPPQREAWRLGIAGIDETAQRLHNRGFADLSPDEQDHVLARIAGGDPPGDGWARIPARRFFMSVLLPSIAKVYYAHPSAWSEIGYSGPSSPRGHVRNWIGGVDPWDAKECEALGDRAS